MKRPFILLYDKLQPMLLNVLLLKIALFGYVRPTTSLSGTPKLTADLSILAVTVMSAVSRTRGNMALPEVLEAIENDLKTLQIVTMGNL